MLRWERWSKRSIHREREFMLRWERGGIMSCEISTDPQEKAVKIGLRRSNERVDVNPQEKAVELAKEEQ